VGLGQRRLDPRQEGRQPAGLGDEAVGRFGGGLLEGLRLRRGTGSDEKGASGDESGEQAEAASPWAGLHLHSFLKNAVSAWLIGSSEAFCRISRQSAWRSAGVVGAAM